MNTRIVKILTTFLFLFFAAGIVKAEAGDTDFVIADNVIEAVKNIDIVSLNVLLAEGESVNTVDEDGNTPLMIAAKIGNPRMLDIILAHNPDVNAKNNSGDTALMISSEQGVEGISRTLIQNGADVSMTNSEGFTSRQIALRNGHRNIAKLMRNSQDDPVLGDFGM